MGRAANAFVVPTARRHAGAAGLRPLFEKIFARAFSSVDMSGPDRTIVRLSGPRGKVAGWIHIVLPIGLSLALWVGIMQFAILLG